MCATLVGVAVYAKMKRQSKTVISTKEIEFITGCVTTKMTKYFRALPDDVLIKYDLNTLQINATYLWDDNEASENMANNGKREGCLRHIDIQYYAVQEWVQRKVVVIRRVCSK